MVDSGSGVQAQRPDGTWEVARPIDWQPGIDWEVYKPGWLGAGWRAEAYEGPNRLATVQARTRLGLALKIHRVGWRLRRGR